MAVSSPRAARAIARRAPASAAVWPRALRPCLLLLLLLAAALRPPVAAAAAQVRVAPDSTLVVRGVVRGDGGATLAGARVTVESTALGVVTDDSGAFRITGLPRGAGLRVRRIGFAPRTVSAATIGESLDRRAPLVVTLQQTALALAPVVVRAAGARRYTGPLAAFERRKDAGTGGHFITADDIDRRNPYQLTDMLRMLPSMRVEDDGRGGKVVRMRSRSCDPLVWLDGMPLVGGYLDIDVLVPRSVAGIEIYSGDATVPPELRGPRGEGTCGVIAVWSRHGERSPKRGRSSAPVSAEQLAVLHDSARVYTADQVDTAAELGEGSPIAPAYPQTLKDAGVSGTAIVEFVVDTTGSVEPETFGVISSSHRLFSEAARQALAEARFTPATLAGRHVRQVVQLPVRFQATPGAP